MGGIRGDSRAVTLTNRCLAKAVDLFLIFLASLILPHPAGVFLGLLYILAHDGLPGGQSVGKRLLGFRVITFDGTGDGGHGPQIACDYMKSALRNAPLGVATFFAIIPFWGWIISIIVGIPMIAIELYLMATRENGTRLGDVMADSRVVQAPAKADSK